MKRRIKETTNSNGEVKYIVQFKLLWFWIEECSFWSYEEARNFATFKPDVKVVYHDLP